MSAEKIIRSQARESLKGNWTAAVSGVFVLLAKIFLVVTVYYLILSLSDIYDGENIKNGCEYIIIISMLCAFILSLALSPLKNGYFRLCYNIAKGDNDGLRDVFYFFSGTKRYFKAIQFNIIILLKRALYSIIGFIPYFLFVFMKAVMFNLSGSPTDSAKQAAGAVEPIIIGMCAVITAVICIRLLIQEFVFVDNCEADVFGISKIITKSHLSDYYRLVFSFLLWLVLCIFVLPGLYVIPYFTTALGTSSKWLINLYKEGKTV